MTLVKLTVDDKLFSVLGVVPKPGGLVNLDYMRRSKVMSLLNLARIGSGNLCPVLVLTFCSGGMLINDQKMPIIPELSAVSDVPTPLQQLLPP